MKIYRIFPKRDSFLNLMKFGINIKHAVSYKEEAAKNTDLATNRTLSSKQTPVQTGAVYNPGHGRCKQAIEITSLVLFDHETLATL
jgi:hypothetical protein